MSGRSYVLEYIVPLLVGVVSSLLATAYWTDPRRSVPISAGLIILSIAAIFILRKRHEHALLGKIKIYPSFTRAYADILAACQDSTYLHVVAIRGLHIFRSDPYAAIFHSLSYRKAEIRVLVLDPDSDSMKHYLSRTLPLASINEYLSDWQVLAERLLDQRASGTNISVRTYKCAPLWKLLVTSKYCFFIGYTDNKRGHSLPLIRVDNSSNCFAIALQRYFADLWEDSVEVVLPRRNLPRAEAERPSS